MNAQISQNVCCFFSRKIVHTMLINKIKENFTKFHMCAGVERNEAMTDEGKLKCKNSSSSIQNNCV